MKNQNEIIRNSLSRDLLVHYDISRQGLTQNDIVGGEFTLKDLSRMDKPEFTYTWNDLTKDPAVLERVNDTLWHYTGSPTAETSESICYVVKSGTPAPGLGKYLDREPFYIRVYGLKESQGIYVSSRYRTSSEDEYTDIFRFNITEDGIYKIPAIHMKAPDSTYSWVDFFVGAMNNNQYDLYIEVVSNHHDMPMHNFATDRAGIGYYPIYFSNVSDREYIHSLKGGTQIQIDPHTIGQINDTIYGKSYNPYLRDTPSFRLRVAGNFDYDSAEETTPNNIVYYYCGIDGAQKAFHIRESGDYTLPYSYNSLYKTSEADAFNLIAVGKFDGTISILPVRDEYVDITTRPIEKWWNANKEGTTVVGNTAHFSRTNFAGLSNNIYLSEHPFIQSIEGNVITTKPLILKIEGLVKNTFYLTFSTSVYNLNTGFSYNKANLYKTSTNGIITVPSCTITVPDMSEDHKDLMINWPSINIKSHDGTSVPCDVTVSLLQNSGSLIFERDDRSYGQIFPYTNTINIRFTKSGLIYTTGEAIAEGYLPIGFTNNFDYKYVPKFRAKITGVTENLPSGDLGFEEVYFFLFDSDGDIHRISSNITEDGIYDIPDIDTSDIVFNEAMEIFLNLNSLIGKPIKVDILPYGGIVPALSKDRGFTIIADRDILFGQPSESNVFNSVIASKAYSAQRGAFLFEEQDTAGLKNCVYSFGVKTDHTYQDNGISWMTSKSYNGSTINIGNKDDEPYLWLGLIRNSYKVGSRFQLRKFLLFDRDLTEQEIEWVKNNML